MNILFNSPEYHTALSIRREVFVKEQKVPEEIEVDEYESSSDHFLSFHAGSPAGTGRMRIKDGSVKFERIAVLATFRGYGLGRKIMEEMMTFAAAKFPGMKGVMNSQFDAAPFYEKLGWKREGELFYEAGIPHVAMSCDLLRTKE